MIVQRRGKNIALIGAVLQTVLSGVMLAIWLATDSLAAMACTWFLAVGVLIWLMAGMVFYCRQMERREALEGEEIAAGSKSTIFQREGDDLHPAANRVRFIERWIAPSFALLLAVGQFLIVFFMARMLKDARVAEAPFLMHPGAGIIFALLAGFAGFLFSRYCVGMGERSEWRLLRATGSYMTVNVMVMAATVVSLGCAYFATTTPASAQSLLRVDLLVAALVIVIQLVFAIEMVLNFVLDLYRPRVPGQEERFSFDSRLYNLIAQPGRVGHSLAEAINYQFGFEVSKSWFYRLVIRALVPMMLFGILLMIALSSIVVVENGQKAVLTHWGQFNTIVGPGIHVKWPWPIDSAQHYDADRVQNLLLGVGQPRKLEDRKGAIVSKGWVYREIYLWKEDHGPIEERDFVVASPPRDASNKAPALNLIKLVVSVQYSIDKLADYVQYTDAPKMLECLASKEMVQYCAAATLDKGLAENAEGRPEAIMTFGRGKAGEKLKELIQVAADKLKLGVHIDYVGLQAVHLPKEVVPDDEMVLEAERRQTLARYEAQADANRLLAAVAGDTATAKWLVMSIRKKEDLETLRLAGEGAFKTKMGEVQRRVRDELATLEKEIEQDRLLGRVGSEAGSDATADDSIAFQKQLVQACQDYLKQLQALEAKSADAAGLRKALDDGMLAANAEADKLLAQALGRPATVVAQAQSARWTREMAERASAEAFDHRLQAYQASPEVYMQDRWLDVWDEVLPTMTKYVLCADRDKVEVRLNWETTKGAMSGVDFGESKK
jgi:modulator of FtsH protease HflK